MWSSAEADNLWPVPQRRSFATFEHGKIYVGEFDASFCEKKIEEFLYQYFARFGCIKSMNFFRNCYEKIFAFVTFESEEVLVEILSSGHPKLLQEVLSSVKNRTGYSQSGARNLNFFISETVYWRPSRRFR